MDVSGRFPLTQTALTPRISVGFKESESSTETTRSSSSEDSPSAATLTEQELKEIQTLKARDREVRAHEAAHLAVAGSLALGGANYNYQRGPDGVLYAVSGEVNIDTSAVAGNPEATLDKAQRIRAAALAPAQPSSQDLRVAAQAAQLAIQARSEINQQADAEQTSEAADNTNTPTDLGLSITESIRTIQSITEILDEEDSTLLDRIA